MNCFKISEFTKNVLTLSIGTTLAQALPIAVSPILTRIYSPDDFGILALFISISLIFGSIANLRYELAVVLPERDEDAISVFILGCIVTFIISSVLFVVFFSFGTQISALLNNDEIEIWLYFVPLVVFFIGIYNMLKYFSIRFKEYKSISKSQILKSLFMSIIQVFLGIKGFNSSGLIIGQISSHFFANLGLINNVLKKTDFSYFNHNKLKSIGLRYIDFPKFSAPSILSNSLSNNLINILISIFYSSSILGFYSLAIKTISSPFTLIGNSIGQVFFQESTVEKNNTGLIKNTFDKTLKKLIIFSSIIFVSLFFVAEEVFGIIFGAEWEKSGLYVKYLCPLFFFKFIGASLSNTLNVFEKQNIALLWQLILLILSLLIFVFFVYTNQDFENFIITYSFIISSHYLLLLFMIRNLSYKGSVL